MSAAVTAGERVAVPSATERTAVAISRGGVSLSRNPAAPAASAAYTYSSRWKVVRPATCGGCGRGRGQGGVHVPVRVDGREAGAVRRVGQGRDRPRRGEPVHHRHPDVDQDD